MIKKLRPYQYFLLGCLSILLIFLFSKLLFKTGKNENNDNYLLTNQITKMNKMVVMEQNFTTTMTNSVSYEILGATISNNKIVTFTTTNAQVSYDLSKMKLEVDSSRKLLIIKELPSPEIKVTPNVEIKSMDDSFFNRINEAQIKKVTQESKENALKQIDEKKLKEEGKKQLRENLNQIFVLAKALHYSIEDKTGTLDISQL